MAFDDDFGKLAAAILLKDVLALVALRLGQPLPLAPIVAERVFLAVELDDRSEPAHLDESGRTALATRGRYRLDGHFRASHWIGMNPLLDLRSRGPSIRVDLAVMRIPARIIRLEPFHIFLVRQRKPEEAGRPQRISEQEEIVMRPVGVLLGVAQARRRIDAIFGEAADPDPAPILIDPAIPGLHPGLDLELGAIFEQHAEHRREIFLLRPEGIVEIGVQIFLRRRIIGDRHDRLVAIRHMAKFVGLDRQEYGRRDFVAIGGRPFGDRHDQRIGEAGLTDKLKIDRTFDRVARNEAVGEHPLHAFPQRSNRTRAARIVMTRRIMIVLGVIVVEEAALMGVDEFRREPVRDSRSSVRQRWPNPTAWLTRRSHYTRQLQGSWTRPSSSHPTADESGCRRRDGSMPSSKVPNWRSSLTDSMRRIFLGDELELLFRIDSPYVFGGIFRPVLGEIPVEALQPAVNFLRIDAGRRAVDAQRVCCRFRCGT